MIITSKLSDLLNSGSCLRQSLEDSTDVGSWLHGDDSELVFFVDPHKERLIIIVEDTTALWPVAVETSGLKETISLLEKEVVGNKLLLIIIRHTFEWVVLSF